MSSGSRPFMPRRMRPAALLCVMVLAAACRRESPPGTASAPAAGERVAFAATTPPPPQGQGQGKEVTPRVSVPPVAEQLTDAFANAAQAIRPSVVRIDVEIARATAGDRTRGEPANPDVPDFLKRFFDFGGRGQGIPGVPAPSQAPVRGTGSGVIIDAQGHIVTNAHVVENAQKVTISLVDGRKVTGKVLGRDPLTDVAVVQASEGQSQKLGTLTSARVGNSDQLRVAQWVLAVGSPLGLDQSVTAGIVSGLGTGHSRVRVAQRARGYIQTDASINPGNSGGPLVNLAGEVVGINTMINVGPGGAYGYAIPINQVARISQTLIKEGHVRYPYIGVNLEDVDNLTDEGKQRLGGNVPAEGGVVVNVVPGSPAAEAGIKSGDVIVKIDDHKISDASDVVDYVSGKAIGNKIKLELVRSGKTQSVEATLREMPGEEGGEAGGQVGVALQTVTEDLARSLGLPPSTKGAVVAEVKPDSPAARAGLQPGDVIVEVDRKPVTSADAAAAALHGGGKRDHLLRVVGPNGPRFVTLPASP
jgi:serine protease Do